MNLNSCGSLQVRGGGDIINVQTVSCEYLATEEEGRFSVDVRVAPKDSTAAVTSLTEPLRLFTGSNPKLHKNMNRFNSGLSEEEQQTPPPAAHFLPFHTLITHNPLCHSGHLSFLLPVFFFFN